VYENKVHRQILSVAQAQNTRATKIISHIILWSNSLVSRPANSIKKNLLSTDKEYK